MTPLGWTNIPEPFTSVLCSSCQPTAEILCISPVPGLHFVLLNFILVFSLQFLRSLSFSSLIAWSFFLLKVPYKVQWDLLNTPCSVLRSLMKTGSRLKNDPSGFAAAAQELPESLFPFTSTFPTSELTEIHSLGFPMCFSGLIPHLMKKSHIYAVWKSGKHI